MESVRVVVQGPCSESGFQWVVFLSGAVTTDQAKRYLNVVQRFEGWRQESAEAYAEFLLFKSGAGGIQRV